MNWKVGDRAICITPGSRLKGMEVIVTRGLHFISVYGFEAYSVDPGFEPGDFFIGWAAQPENLIPIKDKYDGLELSSWDECPFKPKVVEVV